MPRIQMRDGAKLHFGDNGQGTPVVFLHGYTCTCEDWKEVSHRISNVARVIQLDFRNHGKSEALSPMVDLAQLCEDLGDVIRALGLQEDVVLVGHSMGGMVALEYALQHPEQIRGLVLADSFTHLYTGGSLFTADVVSEDTPRHLRRKIEHQMAEGQRRLDGTLFNSLLDWDVRPQVSALPVPTLCLYGDRYGKVTSEDLPKVLQEFGFAQNSNVTCQLIRHSHHFIQLEQPDLVEEACRNWLTSIG